VTRETSTQWYIGAWIVWMGAMLGFWFAYRHVDTVSRPWFADSNLTAIASVVQCSIVVMFVSWIGALVGLARRRQWRWFTAVLITHLLGAGIAGMVSYAGNGPDGLELSRPQLT
jgi:hypothetical protein